MGKRKIVILGATGSVGNAVISVIGKNPEKFDLIGIAAHRNATALQTIKDRFSVPNTSLFSEEGIDGLLHLATLKEADCVIVATTGTVGVRPTIAALSQGKTVGLANKETLVLAGPFVMEAASKAKGTLLPVDSEHNAIFQCLEATNKLEDVKRLILTASGGPFLNHSAKELEEITPAQALQHPNWEMGQKITIDSATMANKGLEMIEAHWLFGVEAKNIEVVIHPQSLIHSMVECVDGSILAQLAPPSMEFPVQHVLSYPERLQAPLPTIDFSRIHRLDIRPPDLDKFPCLRLAAAALAAGGSAPPVFNAANSVAVEAFLKNKLSFNAMPRLIEACLEKAHFKFPASIEDLLSMEIELEAFAQTQLKALR